MIWNKREPSKGKQVGETTTTYRNHPWMISMETRSNSYCFTVRFYTTDYRSCTFRNYSRLGYKQTAKDMERILRKVNAGSKRGLHSSRCFVIAHSSAAIESSATEFPTKQTAFKVIRRCVVVVKNGMSRSQPSGVTQAIEY